MGQVHALQQGSLSPTEVSPKIRSIAAHISQTDARHFAETKHNGLPEKSAGSHRFLAMVRNVAGGGQGLETSSPAVSAAAKRYEPRDGRSMPLDNGVTTSAALTKMSNVMLLCAARHLCKQADVHSIIAQTHRAIAQAGAKNRELLNQVNDKDLDRAEAIVRSMTPEERRNPKIINGSRRARIANGSGVKVVEVNQLIKQFEQMQAMMKQMQAGGMGAFAHSQSPAV